MLTDLAHANFWWTAIRQLWAFFDKMVYGLMYWLYQVFLVIANQNILGGAVVKSLIGRMQLIVGVVFIFIMAINIVQGIINPELFTDKDRGTSKLIIRVIVSLMLLASMIPLNIPGGDSSDQNGIISSSQEYTWESALREQGILFGTLTLFQNKVLETNVLGRLVLGNNASSYEELSGSDSDSDENTSNLSSAGNYMASSILKMFITPNQQSDDFIKQIREEENNPNYATDPDDPTQGYICSETDEFKGDNGRFKYYKDEFELEFLFGYIDNTCTLNSDQAAQTIGDSNQEGDFYQFAYLGGYSTAVGIFIDFILVSFSIEIAVRVFKLVILRILGPIAAVSYVIPNSSQSGGMFSSWVKQLVSTYIDVFVRIAIIYFSILVVSGVLSEHSKLFVGISNGVEFTAIIFLIIGLFLFAKQAPNFIRQMFGMPESSTKGIFSGIGSLIGAGVGFAGVAASGISGWSAGMATQKELGNGKVRTFLGGATGAIGGMFAGTRAALGSEKNADRGKAAMEAVRQKNALRLAQARANVKPTDKLKNRWQSLIYGEPVSSNLEADADKFKKSIEIRQDALDEKQEKLQNQKNVIAQLEGKKSAIKNIKSYATEKALTNEKTKGYIKLGGNVYEGNYRDVYAQMKAIHANGGKGNVKFDGGKTLSYQTVEKYFEPQFEKNAISDFIANKGYGDPGMQNLQNNAINEGFSDSVVTSSSEIGKAIGNLQNDIDVRSRDVRNAEQNLAFEKQGIATDQRTLVQKQKEIKRQSTIDNFNNKK